MVLLLAQPHINVDVPDGGGDTALMYAADHGSQDIVDLLMKAGANPNLKDSWGQTASDMAERVMREKKLSSHTSMSAEEWLNPVVINGFRE